MDRDRPSAGGFRLTDLWSGSSSSGDGEGSASRGHSGSTIDWWLITPLIFTTLPLIRITLRHRPRLRDRVFSVAVAAGLAHGTYLIMRSSDSATTDGARKAETYYQPHQVAVAAVLPKRVPKPASPSPDAATADGGAPTRAAAVAALAAASFGGESAELHP